MWVSISAAFYYGSFSTGVEHICTCTVVVQLNQSLKSAGLLARIIFSCLLICFQVSLSGCLRSGLACVSLLASSM